VISIRDRFGDKGFLLYEFNRAQCRILLDASFKADKPSDPEVRDRILGDLRAAARSRWLRTQILKSEPFVSWLKLNGLGEQDLVSSGVP
jgi:hypothetical protein